MTSERQYHLIMVVDIEGFGRRRNPTQRMLRERLYETLERAVSESGLDFGALPPEDRGDGMFWLIPAAVSKEQLCGRFIDRLQDGLREYARHASSEAVLRLRLALHAGEVAADPHGWSGEDLNTACRLADLKELKDALAAATRAGLAVAVTDAWHASVIRHGYPEVAPDSYRPVPFIAKEVRSRAWIRVPGYDAPPGVRPMARDEAEQQDSDQASDARFADRPRAAISGAIPGTASAEAATVSAPAASHTTNHRISAGRDINAETIVGGDWNGPRP